MTLQEGQVWRLIRDLNTTIPEGLGARFGAPDLHPFEHASLTIAALWARCLHCIADGDPETPFCEFKQAEAFRFATSSYVGVALGSIAWKACMSGCAAAWEPARLPSSKSSAGFPSLACSSTHKDFVPALINWMEADDKRNPKLHNQKNWKAMLGLAWNDRENLGQETFDYAMEKAILPSASSPVEVHFEIANLIRKYDQNRRQRNVRREAGVAPRANRYLDKLLEYWMPLALWCRSTDGILKILEPDSRRTEKEAKAVDSNISKLTLFRLPADERNEFEENLIAAQRRHAERYNIPYE